jgi:hypothetical protein
MTLFSWRYAIACFITLAALPGSPFLLRVYSQTLGTCTFDPTTNKCIVQGGTLCASGTGAGTCNIGEGGCWCVTPTYTLTVAPFNSTIGANSIISTTVTITPQSAAGFIGDVQLSCSASSPLPCTFNPNPVSSKGPAPVISTLWIPIPASATCQTFTITVTAHDTGSVLGGPSNGPQSTTFTVNANCVADLGPDGGGSIALITFMGLLTLWAAAIFLRRKGPIRRI